MINEIKLDKLSVIGRASEAYVKGDLEEVKQLTERLYMGQRFPFMISKDYPYPLHLFSPRLSNMLEGNSGYLDAQAVWQIITARENIIRMITLTELNRTAAESLGSQFEEMLPPVNDTAHVARKQMIGYMIKIVMESFGYIVASGRMQIDTSRKGADNSMRRTNYFKSATRYTKMCMADRDALLDQIVDLEVKRHFMAITDLIIKGETAYQKAYNIAGLTYWESL